MYIKEETYHNKLTLILYADKGMLLQHKETKLCYGSVSLEEDRKQEDYNEIEAPKQEIEENIVEETV